MDDKKIDKRTPEEKLASLRNGVDIIDATLLENLDHRFALIQKIGELKQDHDISVEDPTRFHDMMKYRRSL